MKPDVSVISVNYNTKDLILDLIATIQKEGSKLNKEIIIVDNGSTDGSVPVLKKIKDKNVKVILNSGNLGYAKANNQGVGYATGKYLLLLNSDIKIRKNNIKDLVDFAEKHSDAGVVGCRLKLPDGSIQKSVFKFPTITQAIKEYFLGIKNSFGPYVPQEETPVVVDALVGAVFLITPKARKHVGLLSEKYFMYFEDMDYCKRVKTAGLKVYFDPAVEIIHYHGASGKKLAKSAQQWKRLIPSSKIYHGTIKHYLLTGVLALGQKWQKYFKTN